MLDGSILEGNPGSFCQRIGLNLSQKFAARKIISKLVAFDRLGFEQLGKPNISYYLLATTATAHQGGTLCYEIGLFGLRRNQKLRGFGIVDMTLMTRYTGPVKKVLDAYIL